MPLIVRSRVRARRRLLCCSHQLIRSDISGPVGDLPSAGPVTGSRVTDQVPAPKVRWRYATIAPVNMGGGRNQIVTGVPISRPTMRGALSVVVLIVVVGLLSFTLRAYAVQDYVVPSGSMIPTLQIGDRIAVDKLSSTIHRGDIIVFNRAPGDHDLEYHVLVKRVVGLPGETISSVGDTILIDGTPIAQPWLPTLEGVCYQAAANIRPTTIPAGQYFVMGDCRGDSGDSRYWGTVPVSCIIGKVSAVIWRHNHPWLHWF